MVSINMCQPADHTCRFQNQLGFAAARSFNWHLHTVFRRETLGKSCPDISWHMQTNYCLIYEHIDQIVLYLVVGVAD
jgi:hypothetical protein